MTTQNVMLGIYAVMISVTMYFSYQALNTLSAAIEKHSNSISQDLGN